MSKRRALRLAVRLGWTAPALLATAAAAQVADDRARIEEFAVPQATQSSRIDQLSTTAAPIAENRQPHDRTLASPERTGPPGEMPDQLSSVAQSRTRTAGVSSTADSEPGAVVHLGGKDRCDPRLDKRELARCLEILELRADEFNAPAPPQLSAEQKLLAEQRERDEELADRSTALRLRFATMTEPDADLVSNQELASIYLGNTVAPPGPGEPAAPEIPADLGEALKGLGIDPGTPPPDGS